MPRSKVPLEIRRASHGAKCDSEKLLAELAVDFIHDDDRPSPRLIEAILRSTGETLRLHSLIEKMHGRGITDDVYLEPDEEEGEETKKEESGSISPGGSGD